MSNVFLIFGYGIPKNIKKDLGYTCYLNTVFNSIYHISKKGKITNPTIICCGGKTDMYKPYTRTESQEIIKYLRELANRPFVEKTTSKWRFIAEKKSLSTLENFLEVQSVFSQQKLQPKRCYIFCEKTRAHKVKTLAKHVLTKQNIRVLPVDFDISKNRYLDLSIIRKREKDDLNLSLSILKNKKNLKKYHKLLKQKIIYLRKAGPKQHQEALQIWWKEKLSELK